MAKPFRFTRNCVPTEQLAERATAARLTRYQCDLLFFSQNNTAKQVAELMGIPVGTVKSGVHRVRAKLLGEKSS